MKMSTPATRSVATPKSSCANARPARDAASKSSTCCRAHSRSIRRSDFAKVDELAAELQSALEPPTEEQLALAADSTAAEQKPRSKPTPSRSRRHAGRQDHAAARDGPQDAAAHEAVAARPRRCGSAAEPRRSPMRAADALPAAAALRPGPPRARRRPHAADVLRAPASRPGCRSAPPHSNAPGAPARTYGCAAADRRSPRAVRDDRQRHDAISGACTAPRSASRWCPGPTGNRVVHVKGLTCFVAMLGGRPSPAVHVDRSSDVALVTPRAQEIGHLRIAQGAPGRATNRVSGGERSWSASESRTVLTRSCSTSVPDLTLISCTLGAVRCPSPGDAGS